MAKNKKGELPEDVLPVLKRVLSDYHDAEERWLEKIASGDAKISDELRERLLAIPDGNVDDLIDDLKTKKSFFQSS